MLAAEGLLSATESQPAHFDLSGEEVALLRSLGRELASTRSWWGATDEQGGGSVVAVDPLEGSRYRVTFRDVVGVVRLPNRQVHVSPKIPLNHFLHIASRSDLAPRLSTRLVSVDASNGFIEVLARWCLDAAEQLLRGGLRREYKSSIDEVKEIRGRVHECATLVEALQGRLVALCEFEELSDDSPMNRVVRAACERLAKLEVLSDVTRGRARRVAFRMDGVGPLEFADLRVRPDRASRAYARVLPLAFLVLAGCGISASVGQHVGSAFLVRTPELIEDGLRAIVRDALPGVDVVKRRLLLGDSGLSVNPDLLFGNGVAVGDVKYRFLGADWSRSDLNQVVTFATAFHCSYALVLGFARDANAPRPRSVPVGPVRAASLAWVASPGLDPAESSRQLEVQVRRWMRDLRDEPALPDSSR